MLSPRIKYGQSTRLNGFTLVEALIALVLLAIGTLMASSLFSMATRLTYSQRKEQEIEAAIIRDIAEIDRINRRAVCTNGSCRVAANDPREDEYYPDPALTSNVSFFNSLCSTQGIANEVASLVDSRSKPPEFSALGITSGSAVVESYSTTPTQTGHRYIVSWTKSSNGNTIRQIVRTPTVAGWCP